MSSEGEDEEEEWDRQDEDEKEGERLDFKSGLDPEDKRPEPKDSLVNRDIDCDPHRVGEVMFGLIRIETSAGIRSTITKTNFQVELPRFFRSAMVIVNAQYSDGDLGAVPLQVTVSVAGPGLGGLPCGGLAISERGSRATLLVAPLEVPRGGVATLPLPLGLGGGETGVVIDIIGRWWPEPVESLDVTFTVDVVTM